MRPGGSLFLRMWPMIRLLECLGHNDAREARGLAFLGVTCSFCRTCTLRRGASTSLRPYPLEANRSLFLRLSPLACLAYPPVTPGYRRLLGMGWRQSSCLPETPAR